MRFIRTVFTLIVVAVIGMVAFNYWSGHGLTLLPSGSTGVEAEVRVPRARPSLTGRRPRWARRRPNSSTRSTKAR